MRRLYFHIGLHKTATTFLQELVFPSLKETTYITRQSVHAAEGWNRLMMADDTLYDPHLVKANTEEWTGDRLLLSSESLSGKPLFFHVVNRSMIARRLKAFFPKAQIILFIRGQESLILSHYNQYVKSRDDGYRGIEEFLWFPGKREIDAAYFGTGDTLPGGYFNTSNFQVHLDTFRHFELIDLYKNLFEKVHVFLFEDLLTDPPGVLSRMETILEDQFHNKSALAQSRINKSLEYPDLYRKRRLNRINVFTGNKFIRAGCRQLFKLWPVKSEGFEEHYVRHVASGYYRENNKKIIEKYPEIGIQNYPEAYKV